MRTRPALFCVLALCLPLYSTLRAQSAPPDLSKYSGEPFVIDNFSKIYRFEADGKLQKDLTTRVHVQSESAVREFGLLVYSYMSSFETLDVLYVRVRKPDGSVVDTPADDIQELDSPVSREAPMYTDQREKHIAVKSLAAGDILEASVRWTTHDPIAPGHFWLDDELFDKGICLDQLVEFNVPAGLSVKLRGDNPAAQIREENGRRIYSFHNAHLTKVEDDDNAKGEKIPDWEKNFRGLDPPHLRISSFTSWADVGAWYSALQQPRIQVTPRVRATAEEITKGKTTEDEKIQAIYDYVSGRFRYIGIDLGFGRYTPHAAEDVLTNRYGDCKDKHTLFAALLEAIGVHAYPALISTKFRIDPEFPSPSLLDHVITAIPRGDSFLFLDTTPEVAPFGMLLAALRDRHALVMPGGSPARLVTTPANPPFPARSVFHMDASIDLNGTLDGKARLEDRGDSEVIFRLAYRNTPQNQWKQLTQRIVGGLGFAGTVDDVVVSPPEKTTDPFRVTFSYHRTDYPDWKENRVTLPFPLLGMVLPELNEAQKKSKDPLPLGSPQELLYETSLKLPEGVSVSVPENVDRKTDFAEYSATYRLEHGILYGERQMLIKTREVPAGRRDSYTSFLKSMNDDANRWILVLNKPRETSPLEQGIAFLRQKQPQKAIEVLEKAAKDNPDDSAINMALGDAYLKEPKPEEDKAVEQFGKVLAAKPDAGVLNGIAYSYAEANIHLPEALDYAARAVAETSAQTMKASADSSDPADFLRAAQLAAEWDTLGWTKFRAGDTAAAHKYLEAAWALSQRAVIGEHLVEVKEKLGKTTEAQRVAQMAAVAPGLNEEPGTRDRLQRVLKHPLPARPNGKLLPHDPGFYNGQADLSDMRTFHVPRNIKIGDKSKFGLFAISFENGKRTAVARFVSGDTELQPEAEALVSVNYRQPFPDATPVRIIRTGYLSCSKYTSDCTLVFQPVGDGSTLPVVAPE